MLVASPLRAADGVSGIASNYGPGNGVAMNFCTWTVRHIQGCGWVQIQSADTGIVVEAPVVDYCLCVVPNSAHPNRIIDLQYGVVAALGLSVSQGLYQVTVWRIEGDETVPDAAVAQNSIEWWLLITLLVLFTIGFILSVIGAIVMRGQKGTYHGRK